MKKVDVAIVGNGILGLEAARILLASERSICILGEAAAPASWAAGGMLVPFAEHIPDDEVLSYSGECVHHWAEHVRQLHDEGIDAGYRPYGVFLPVKPQFAPLYDMIRSRLDQFDEPWEERSWQGLDGANVEGMLLPQAASVANGLLWRSLSERLENDQYFARVQAIEGQIGAFTLVLSDGSRLEASHVLLFPGWQADLLPDTPPRHVPFADRGAMIRVLPPVAVQQEPILFDVDMMAPLYIVPRSNGGITIGATTDPQDSATAWREADEALLLERAAQYLPWISRARISHRWVGLRPKSDTGYPFVGQLRGREGIFVVTGMHRNGILWGPFLAAAVIDMMNGKSPDLPTSFTAC